MLCNPCRGFSIEQNTAKRGCTLPAYDIENFIMKAFNYFSVFSESAEVLSKILDFTEMKKYILLRHLPTTWPTFSLGIENVIKMLASHKLFQSMKKYKNNFLL